MHGQRKSNLDINEDDDQQIFDRLDEINRVEVEEF